jgi:hypothetical protein
MRFSCGGNFIRQNGNTGVTSVTCVALRHIARAVGVRRPGALSRFARASPQAVKRRDVVIGPCRAPAVPLLHWMPTTHTEPRPLVQFISALNVSRLALSILLHRHAALPRRRPCPPLSCPAGVPPCFISGVWHAHFDSTHDSYTLFRYSAEKCPARWRCSRRGRSLTFSEPCKRRFS